MVLHYTKVIGTVVTITYILSFSLVWNRISLQGCSALMEAELKRKNLTIKGSALVFITIH